MTVQAYTQLPQLIRNFNFGKEKQQHKAAKIQKSRVLKRQKSKIDSNRLP